MSRIRINNLSIEELKIYSSFSENRLYHYYEPEPGIFIAESPKVIDRALKAGYEPLSFLAEDDLSDELGKSILVEHEDKAIYTAPLNLLSKLTGYHLTNGLLAAMRRKTCSSIDSLVENAHRLVVIDDVENPTNIGAIFRSAAALGMDAVLLTSSCSDPLYRRAARVSMGTVFQIKWTYCDDYISELHKRDFKLAAMALDETALSISSEIFKKSGRLAIVMGNEGNGLKKESIENCDYTAYIPMMNEVDSLNVAAASAVAFWEMRYSSI